jgi:hypothetical protein
MRGEKMSPRAHFLVRGVRGPLLLGLFFREAVGVGFEGLAAFFVGFFSLFPELLGLDVLDCGAFFLDEDSARVRFAASTRLPIPRCSRASWVGVDVDPDIFFSLVVVFDVSDSEDDVEVDPSLCESWLL